MPCVFSQRSSCKTAGMRNQFLRVMMNVMNTADGQSEASADGWVQIGAATSLAARGRMHSCIQGRYVSILSIKGHLTCIDSICFHAGGPLGLGDIEEVDGKTCLNCPWHNYKIDAFSGEKYYQAMSWVDGKMVPGNWKSNGFRHRIHQVEERSDGMIYVKLDSTPGDVPSDSYAYDVTCGQRVLGSPSTAAGQAAAAAGADGKRNIRLL
eukprot:GHRQ01038288.1.p1 GENE.GHRQ01038288.1~~GHRQ01038288.1.p1  ORF type:complete len:209 (+),score=29.46 GHRQ01038288.1:240-866(+)